MLNSIRTPVRVLGLATALVIAAACSSPAASTAPTTAATAPAATAPSVAPATGEASSVPSAAVGGSYALTIVKDATLGDYLTGKDGMTLYTFMPDATANKSTCNGGCAGNWPPAGETATAGTGVSGTIATFARDDGSTQVSYNGKPVYYFAGDKAAGDTTGQGSGGKWFVAAP